MPKENSQMGFAIAIVVLLIVCVPSLYFTERIYTLGKSTRPEYDWPQITELWKTVVSGVVIIAVKKMVIAATLSFNKTVCKDQDDPEMNEKRALKAGKYIFATIYFSAASAYGYYTLKDGPWLPWYLGGSGTWEALIDNAPYQVQNPGAVTYAMLQLGYHFGDLLLSLVSERQNDFNEMLAHHIATSILLFLMTFTNHLPIGCVIAFLHDTADITASMLKYFSCTVYKIPTVFFFLLNFAVWVYTRNVLLPYMVYRIWTEWLFTYKEPFAQFWGINLCGAIFLSMLVFLHAYWVSLFFQMGYRLVMQGKTEDIQNQTNKKKKAN